MTTRSGAARWFLATFMVLAAVAGIAAQEVAGDEPEADPFLPEQRVFSRNPRLEAWVSTSKALRLRVRLVDRQQGGEVEILPPSPRLYLPRDADYFYALIADAEGGFLLFDRPRFYGVAIYDRRGDLVRQVTKEGEILFAQLPDGRFLLADEGSLAGYTATGEELWQRALPQVDRLDPLPPAAFHAGRYLAAAEQRTSAAIVAATGETAAEFRGPTARPPSILLYEEDPFVLVSSQRQAGGGWLLRRKAADPVPPLELDLPCNPVGADRRGEALALLLTCLDPTDDSRYPQRLLLLDLATGAELARRELGEIPSPTGRYRLDWHAAGELDILLGSRAQRVELPAAVAP